MAIERLQITTLVEDTAAGRGLRGEHGLSFFVESNGGAILFDTGASDLVLANARLLDVDLAKVQAVVISHGHYDHAGGLKAVVGRLGAIRVVGHPAMFSERYARTSDGVVHVAGCPFAKSDADLGPGRFELQSGPAEVLPGIWTTGEVPRVTDFEDTGGMFFVDRACTQRDDLPDDLSIFVETPAGLVVVLGCAHSGVVNILKHVSELSGKPGVHAVVGGMHLLAASPDRLRQTATAFREFGVEHIGIAHCTGLRPTCYFMVEFGEKCSLCNVGTKMCFEA